MFVSGFVSIILNFTSLGPLLFSDTGILESYYKFPMVVLFTTAVWLIVTLLTKPDSTETLINFCKKTNPGGPGWDKIKLEASKNNISFNNIENKIWSVPTGIICMLLGCFAIYSILFSTGFFIYGEIISGIWFLVISLIFTILLKNYWKKLNSL